MRRSKFFWTRTSGFGFGGPLFFVGIVLLSLWRAWRWRYMNAFADEAEAMTGGWLLSRGSRIYQDFFCHHMPLPYFLCALLAWVDPGGDFGKFRLLPWFCWCLAALSLALSPALREKKGWAWVWGALFLLVLSLISYHWWGHMVLADGIWACFFAVFLALFLFPWFYGEDPGFFASFLGGLALCASVFSCQLAVFPAAFLLPFWILSLPTRDWRSVRRGVLPFVGGISAGCVLLAWGLAWKGSFAGFWGQAILFNLQVYPRFMLYPGGASPGPIRELLIDLWKQLAFFRTVRPFFWVCLSLFSASLLPWRRHWRGWVLAAAPVLAVAFFTAMRGGAGGRDLFFHDAPFFTLSIFLGCYGAARLGVLEVRPWILGLVLAAFLGMTQELADQGGMTWHHSEDPYEALAEFKPFVDYVRRNSDENEKITVSNYAPIVYLLCEREPAQDSTYFLPWNIYWEETRGWGQDACAQIHAKPPRFIFLYRGNFEGGWNPQCLVDFAKDAYHLVLKQGNNELWERPRALAGGVLTRPLGGSGK